MQIRQSMPFFHQICRYAYTFLQIRNHDHIRKQKFKCLKENWRPKSLNFEEQIMSRRNIRAYFAPNGGYCVYYPSNLFCNTCSFENWRIFSDIPQFQLGNIRLREVLRPIAHEWKYLMDYKYGLLAKCEVKMAGYWPSSLACKRTRPLSSHLDQTNLVNKGSVTWVSENFSCGIQWVVPSGQDGSILLAQVADHSVRFGSSYLLAELATSKSSYLSNY